MKLTLNHKGMDWVLVVTDYEYQPYEPRTHDHEGCPEAVDVTDGYVQLDGHGTLVSKINKQLWESGYGPLMTHLLTEYESQIQDQLLKVVLDRQAAVEMHHEEVAEEAYQKRRYEDFLNKEVTW